MRSDAAGAAADADARDAERRSGRLLGALQQPAGVALGLLRRRGFRVLGRRLH